MFKRINRFVRDTYSTSENNQNSISENTLDTLSDLVNTIVKYSEKQVDQQTVEAAIYNFSKQIDSSALSLELEANVQMFERKRINDAEQMQASTSFWDTLKSRINLNNLIYALKISVVCAGGMLVTELLNLPKAYLFPLSVIVVTQPYAKLTRKSAGNRILNTIYMVIIYLLAFSFTDIIWLNILILVVLILVGDMILKFNCNVVVTGIIAVAMGSMASSSDGISGTEYALLRLLYVCAACILFVIIDALFFPRHVNESVKKELKKSLACNQTILSLLFNSNTTSDALLQALREKRTINRKIKFNQQYLNLNEINLYLMSDQEWTERVYFLYDSLAEQKLTMQHVSSACDILHSNPTFKSLMEISQSKEERSEKTIIFNMYDILKGMQESEIISDSQVMPALK